MPTIVIRTERPETAFWEPSLVADDGRARLAFEGPARIAPHRLTLVASDANGGVGVLHTTVNGDTRIHGTCQPPPLCPRRKSWAAASLVALVGLIAATAASAMVAVT